MSDTTGRGSESSGTKGGVKPASSTSQSLDAPPAISALAYRIEHIVAPQRPARPVQHRAVRRRDRPPVDAELPCDGAKLRRLHHDAPARAGSRPQHTVGIGAGIVEQV